MAERQNRGVHGGLPRGKPEARHPPVERGEVQATVSNTRAGTILACRRARLAPAEHLQAAVLLQEPDAGRLVVGAESVEHVAEVHTHARVGALVADLYAGSGAVGIEAISRGAAHCTFVERDRVSGQTVAAGDVLVELTDQEESALLTEAESLAEEDQLPEIFALAQNYPNPFSTLTSFTFKLPEARHVQLRIFNALGKEVAKVADRWYGRGIHSEVFQAGDLPSGIYFYKLITEKEIVQKKMLLLR